MTKKGSPGTYEIFGVANRIVADTDKSWTNKTVRDVVAAAFSEGYRSGFEDGYSDGHYDGANGVEES